MSTATVTAPRARPGRAVRQRVEPRLAHGRAPARPTAPVRPIPAVRLTRRGRVVVLVTVLAIALAVFTVLGGPAVSTGQTHHPVSHTVVVSGGETLWDIASRVAPDQDPRVVIADIVDLNNLSDAGSIRIGQELFVPQY